MNAAHKPTQLHARFLMLLVAFAAVAGIAAGSLIIPSRTTVPEYVYALVHPACFGAMCWLALRRGGEAARWTPLLLVAMFLLDIAKGPHVAVLSVLGLGAGALSVAATLRLHQRLAVASMAICCALLAATLVGGLLLR